MSRSILGNPVEAPQLMPDETTVTTNEEGRVALHPEILAGLNNAVASAVAPLAEDEGSGAISLQTDPGTLAVDGSNRLKVADAVTSSIAGKQAAHANLTSLSSATPDLPSLTVGGQTLATQTEVTTGLAGKQAAHANLTSLSGSTPTLPSLATGSVVLGNSTAVGFVWTKGMEQFDPGAAWEANQGLQAINWVNRSTNKQWLIRDSNATGSASKVALRFMVGADTGVRLAAENYDATASKKLTLQGSSVDVQGGPLTVDGAAVATQTYVDAAVGAPLQAMQYAQMGTNQTVFGAGVRSNWLSTSALVPVRVGNGGNGVYVTEFGSPPMTDLVVYPGGGDAYIAIPASGIWSIDVGLAALGAVPTALELESDAASTATAGIKKWVGGTRGLTYVGLLLAGEHLRVFATFASNTNAGTSSDNQVTVSRLK